MDSDELFLLSLSIACPKCGAPPGEQCRTRRIHMRLRDYRVDLISRDGTAELMVLSVHARAMSEAIACAVERANLDRATGSPWRPLRVVDVDDDTHSLIYFIPPPSHQHAEPWGDAAIVDVRARATPRRRRRQPVPA